VWKILAGSAPLNQGVRVPKRVIDGEALWLSNKLRQVPEEYRPEYANLIPLALANGTFECDPRKIWARVYIYNRPSVTLQAVEEMLNSFERAKMLFRWQAEDGAVWGYWVGIEKPGRLPSGTDQKHGAKGAAVPQESLRSFISSGNKPQPDNDQSATSQGPVENRLDILEPLASHGSANGSVADSPATSKPTDERLPAVERVWAYYIQKLGKSTKQLSFTAGRKQKGLARLGECLGKTGGDLTRAEGLMREAVDALAASAWHCGENDRRKRYDIWEANLFKTQEQLEIWLDSTSTSKQGPVPLPMPTRRTELSEGDRAMYAQHGVNL
jgi:hypothetical protein